MDGLYTFLHSATNKLITEYKQVWERGIRIHMQECVAMWTVFLWVELRSGWCHSKRDTIQ